MEETRDRLSRLDWLSDESLASAKRALRREEADRAYYAAAIADEIGSARWWEGDATRAFNREARIDAVTREQVAAAWRKYVGEPKPVRLFVRPEHVPLYVRLFGWLYPLVSR
jgi:predicted Zn-dependent peptidase